MSIKTVMLFQATTGAFVNQPFGGNPAVGQPTFPQVGYAGRQHIGGWTENVYWFGEMGALLTQLTTGGGGQPGLLPSRAALLPANASIVGVRFYQGGAGRGQSRAYNYPGAAAVATDIPQMALLCKGGPINFNVIRRWTVRCIPDIFVAQGEWNPTVDYANAVAAYLGALTQFGFIGTDPPVTTNVAQIVPAAAGTSTVTVQIRQQPFNLGDQLWFQKCKDPAGNLISFTAKMQALVANRQDQFVIDQVVPDTLTGGVVFIKTHSFYSISQATVSRVVTRRVGRPSELFRGRKSRKRRAA